MIENPATDPGQPAIAAVERRPMVALATILLVAFGLRLVLLADADIWWDEGLAVWAARQGVLDMVRWTAADVHPPLYFLLLKLWLGLAGDSAFAVRLFSAISGTLTVAALWYLGRLLAPGRLWIALGGALLLALSPFAIWWSQETRMYMLGGLLATLSLACTVRLRWQPSWRVALAYLATTIAALWTLYLLAFLLIIEGLYWLWSLRLERDWPTRGRLLLQWIGLQVIALGTFAPWLWYAFPRMRSWSAQAAFEPRLYMQLYATLLTVGASTHIARYLPVIAAVAVLILAGLAVMIFRRTTRWGSRPGSILLLFLTIALPPLAVWLVTMLPRSFGYLPKPEARYLLPFAPPFYLLLSWVVVTLAERTGRARPWIGTGVTVALIIMSAWGLHRYYGDRYRTDNYESIALTLRAHAQSEDAVILHTDQPWPVFAYHWPGEFVGIPYGQPMHEDTAQNLLAPIWQAHEAVWLVINEDALRMDPGRQFEAWLNTQSPAHHEWRLGSKRLLLFAKNPSRTTEPLPLAADTAASGSIHPIQVAEAQLVGWEQALRRVKAGEVAHLAIYVQRTGENTSLEVLLGQPGYAHKLVEIPPGEGLARIAVSIPVPPDCPGGVLPWRVRMGEIEVTAGHVRVLPRPPVQPQGELAPQHEIQATFGESAPIRLLGYDLSSISTSEGAYLRVTLYWRALDTPPLSYKVFTHLLDASGQVVSQRDDFPVRGTRQTTTWVPDETVLDTYDIPLPPELPTGQYTLVVGFYDPTTNNRLGPVKDHTDTVQPGDQMPLGPVGHRSP